MTGDGVHDIATLVEAANADPRRGEGHARPLTRIPLDGEALACLAAQGLEPGCVPGPGEAVRLRRNANLSTGGCQHRRHRPGAPRRGRAVLPCGRGDRA